MVLSVGMVFLMATNLGGQASSVVATREVRGQATDPRYAKVVFPYSLDFALKPEQKSRRMVIGLQSDSTDLSPVVKRLGGQLLTVTKSTATAILTNDQTLRAMDEGAVKSVNFGQIITDVAVSHNSFRRNLIDLAPVPPSATRRPAITSGGLDKVHSGGAPLERGYRGTGVLVGVIEGSLPDFRHPDFRGADGRTRFLGAWDMTLPGSGPKGYGYGTYWSKEQIDRMLRSGEARHLVFGQDAEHPTNSLGVAAGNGLGWANAIGVAPDSAIICVAAGYSNVNVIDAARFIFQEADRRKMPCVISISMAADQLQGRPENGNNIAAVALSEMVEEKSGRIIVSSSGNQASSKMHASIDCGSASTLLLKPVTSQQRPSYTSTLVLEGASRQSAEFQILLSHGLSKPETSFSATEWMTAAKLTQSGPLQFDLADNTARPSTGAQVKCTAKWDSPTSTQVGLQISGLTKDQQLKEGLMVKVRFRGAGHVDAWTDLFLPMIGADGYVVPDNLMSVPSPANGRSVFAAGAFHDGESRALADYSQPGGLYFGVWKPVAVAPVDILAANPLDSPMDAKERVGGGGYVTYTGTSCASPVLAGAIALYLQKHPDATPGDVMRALRLSAVADSQTGATPNPKTGYGKLDFYGLLKQ